MANFWGVFFANMGGGGGQNYFFQERSLEVFCVYCDFPQVTPPLAAAQIRVS